MIAALTAPACGSPGGEGGTGSESCQSIPKTQGASEACCPAWGVDACGASLFCAAFDGRTQATCYPLRSRADRAECTADEQCASASCNAEAGGCRSTPFTACDEGFGCAPDPQGGQYACQGATCQPYDAGQGAAIDTGAPMPQFTMGDGVGVLVLYKAGGHWSVTTACDTNFSGNTCAFDVTATAVPGSSLTNAAGTSLEPDDTLTTGSPVALEAKTGGDYDGMTFDAPPGASVTFSVRVGGALLPKLLVWSSNGELTQGSTSPTTLTPTSP